MQRASFGYAWMTIWYGTRTMIVINKEAMALVPLLGNLSVYLFIPHTQHTKDANIKIMISLFT